MRMFIRISIHGGQALDQQRLVLSVLDCRKRLSSKTVGAPAEFEKPTSIRRLDGERPREDHAPSWKVAPGKRRMQ